MASRDGLHDATMDIVHRARVKGQSDPSPLTERRGDPCDLRIELALVGRKLRARDDEAVWKAAKVRVWLLWSCEVGGPKNVSAFCCTSASERDELGQVAIAVAIGGEGDERHGVGFVGVHEAEIRSNDEREICSLGFDVRTNDAGERTFVGHGDRGVVQLLCACDQLLGM